MLQLNKALLLVKTSHTICKTQSEHFFQSSYTIMLKFVIYIQSDISLEVVKILICTNQQYISYLVKLTNYY